MTSSVTKRAIYLDGKISLAHAPLDTFKPGHNIIKWNYLQNYFKNIYIHWK